MSAPSSCKRCGARMKVATSKRASPETQLQYLVCPSCSNRSAREVPAAAIWRRRR